VTSRGADLTNSGDPATRIPGRGTAAQLLAGSFTFSVFVGTAVVFGALYPLRHRFHHEPRPEVPELAVGLFGWLALYLLFRSTRAIARHRNGDGPSAPPVTPFGMLRALGRLGDAARLFRLPPKTTVTALCLPAVGGMLAAPVILVVALARSLGALF
jgi:hypothetical protein